MEVCALTRLFAGCQEEGMFFSISCSLEQGQVAISVWAELEPTHPNLFIFLGGIQGTGERQ